VSPFTAPVPATTTTGAPLPLVSLPQDELLTVAEATLPWIENALGEGIHFKPLRLDLERDEWVALATFKPGGEIQLHYHTGPAEVYTLQGRWLSPRLRRLEASHCEAPTPSTSSRASRWALPLIGASVGAES
jgi:hypothetical protein